LDDELLHGLDEEDDDEPPHDLDDELLEDDLLPDDECDELCPPPARASASPAVTHRMAVMAATATRTVPIFRMFIPPSTGALRSFGVLELNSRTPGLLS
jgi:hypothetical protein